MSSDLVDEVIEKLVPHLFCYLIIAGQASRELLPRNSARRHRWPPSKIGGAKRDMIRKLKENCFAWADTLALSAKERTPAHCCRGVLVGSALMPSREEEGLMALLTYLIL